MFRLWVSYNRTIVPEFLGPAVSPLVVILASGVGFRIPADTSVLVFLVLMVSPRCTKVESMSATANQSEITSCTLQGMRKTCDSHEHAVGSTGFALVVCVPMVACCTSTVDHEYLKNARLVNTMTSAMIVSMKVTINMLVIMPSVSQLQVFQ